MDTEGISCVNLWSTYNIDEVIYENAMLMSFEQVDDIARSNMKELLESDVYIVGDVTVPEIKMGYMTISYDGASYSLVPVWIYYVTTFSQVAHVKRPLLGVNALDGGVILFFEW